MKFDVTGFIARDVKPKGWRYSEKYGYMPYFVIAKIYHMRKCDVTSDGWPPRKVRLTIEYLD